MKRLILFALLAMACARGAFADPAPPKIDAPAAVLSIILPRIFALPQNPPGAYTSPSSGAGGCSVTGFTINHLIANDGAGNCTDAGFSSGNVVTATRAATQTIQASGSNITLNVNGGNSGASPALASTCALTTDATDCVAESESAASTNGTLTNGLANQAILATSTATNSTAAPLEVAQGSITNTVATPAAQIEATWNNAGLTGEGFLVNITNTASNAASRIFDWRVGNTTVFSSDVNGQLALMGNASTGAPPPSATTSNNVGWKQCYFSNTYCMGVSAATIGFSIGNAANSWLYVTGNTTFGSGSVASPPTGAATSLATSGGILMTENACATNITNIASTGEICQDSTAHEFLAYTRGSTTSGMLVRAQPSPINSAGLVALVANGTTLCAAANGACNVAGQYHVHINVWGSGTACATPSPGGVTPNLSWTDENGTAHANVVIPMMSQTGASSTAVNVSAPTVAFQSALANEGGSGDFTISTNGTVIQYGVAYAACGSGTGTYNIRIAVTRLQ